MRRRLSRVLNRRLIALVLLVLAVFIGGAVVWLNTPSGAVMPEALAALESDDAVRVVRTPFIAFEPTGRDFTQGFIFYPGGRVAAEAYAPLARQLALEGVVAVLTPMPFNLAILNPGAATAVIDAYPLVSDWVIGGHSLGGVMAARYAHNSPGPVRGLVLLAAYPEAQFDLSARELAVATVYGDRDGLASLEEIENSFPLLPGDARRVRIEGGNHAQFGWYGEQAGDQPATISRAEQQGQVVATILQLLREAGN